MRAYRLYAFAVPLMLGFLFLLPGCSAQHPAQSAALEVEGQVQPASRAGVQAPSASKPDNPAVPEDDAKAVNEFKKRVAEYVRLHKSLESVPGVPDKAESEVIAAHKQQIAAAIQAARQGARPGDILSPAESYFRRMIGGDLRKDGDARETVLTDGNPRSPETAPTETVKVAVNAAYPENAPVSTVPPTLLLHLPPLPEELHYRFVGRHLILHDIHADLIVDYLLNVVP